MAAKRKTKKQAEEQRQPWEDAVRTEREDWPGLDMYPDGKRLVCYDALDRELYSGFVPDEYRPGVVEKTPTEALLYCLDKHERLDADPSKHLMERQAWGAMASHVREALMDRGAI